MFHLLSFRQFPILASLLIGRNKLSFPLNLRRDVSLSELKDIDKIPVNMIEKAVENAIKNYHNDLELLVFDDGQGISEGVRAI